MTGLVCPVQTLTGNCKSVLASCDILLLTAKTFLTASHILRVHNIFRVSMMSVINKIFLFFFIILVTDWKISQVRKYFTNCPVIMVEFRSGVRLLVRML